MPNHSFTYDYIFCGFGLSAMLLYLELRQKQAFKHHRFLILDSEAKNTNDKTWSYWSKREDTLPQINKKEWEIFNVANSNKGKLTLQSDTFVYRSIKSKDLYQYVFTQLNKDPNVQFVQDRVQYINKKENKVIATNKEYKGRKFINSIIDPKKIEQSSKNLFLWQHFGGYFIKTDKQSFNEKECMLMDFRIQDGKPCSFMYILPYSDTEALVEYTLFDNTLLDHEAYTPQIEQYIKQTLHIDSYEIKQKEYGKIPMTTALKAKQSKRILEIGQNAGYCKPSTGYSFGHSLIASKHLAKHFFEVKDFSHLKPMNRTLLTTLTDEVILDILKYQRINAREVFYNVFALNPINRTIRFLTEQHSLNDTLGIMRSVKKKWIFFWVFLKRVLVSCAK